MAWQPVGSGSSEAAACRRHRGGSGQRGSDVGSVAVVGVVGQRHHSGGGGGGGRTLPAAGLGAAASVWQHRGISSSSRVAGAALLPRATMVATKKPAATAMAGAQTSITNQLKAAATMAMETATTTTPKM